MYKEGDKRKPITTKDVLHASIGDYICIVELVMPKDTQLPPLPSIQVHTTDNLYDMAEWVKGSTYTHFIKSITENRRYIYPSTGINLYIVLSTSIRIAVLYLGKPGYHKENKYLYKANPLDDPDYQSEPIKTKAYNADPNYQKRLRPKDFEDIEQYKALIASRRTEVEYLKDCLQNHAMDDTEREGIQKRLVFLECCKSEPPKTNKLDSLL